MKIYVDLDHVDITEYTQIESGEYNTNKINFIFTPEYKDLVKVAIFGCKLDTEEPKFYKVYLTDDSCYIPSEVLEISDVITIGCYGYKASGETLNLRYSPTPVKVIVYEGSFREGAENSSPLTPTEVEQIMSRIATLDDEVDDLDDRVTVLEGKACDVDSIKERVTDLEVDVDTINNKIDIIELDIDDLEGDIANTYSKTEVDTLLGAKVDTTTFNSSQAAQDEKIAKAELILSQLPKVTGEGTNISLSPTIEYDLEVESYKGDTSQDGTPTPDTPVDIQVVTGTQTLTISNSDNTESQTYTLHLGDLELAKIGSYQDYIYYDNGKWYKYGAIGKHTLSSSDTINYEGSFPRFSVDNIDLFPNTEGRQLVYCNRYSYISSGSADYGIFSYYQTHRVYIYDKDYSSVDNLKTYFTNNNTYFYYMKNTPTSTEITNETLLSDLEYIRTHAMSYNGTTNISSSGNLPIIISASALKQLS